MKTKLLLTASALLLLSTLNSQLATAFAQGSLTPPGAPAPLFKTLDQVKPGTPITSVPFTITNSGFFFLTKSFTTTGDGIIITSDDVTLDLGGFTLTGDGGSSDDGVLVGASVSSGQSRLTIRNGTVRNFGKGVDIGRLSSSILVEDVLAYGCTNGIQLFGSVEGAPQRCTVRHCYAVSNANGILIANPAGVALSAENLIVDCVAQGNVVGILVQSTNNLVIRNLSFGNSGNDYTISPNNRIGAIVAPAVNANSSITSSPGSGTTDPFANLRY